MSLTLTDFSSGSPNNGRSLGRSSSLNAVLLPIYFFFTNAIFSHRHNQGDRGAEEVSRDVESGGGEALQLQEAADNAFVVPAPPIVVVVGGGGGSTQVAETTITQNQTFVSEVEPGRAPASNVSEQAHAILSVPQFIGQQVVGIWIVPTLVGIISSLIQLAVGSQRANEGQALLLYFCYGISLGTAILGIVLFILSNMNWNNPRRDLIISSIVVTSLGSTFVDICVLITFVFIVVQSKAHE